MTHFVHLSTQIKRKTALLSYKRPFSSIEAQVHKETCKGDIPPLSLDACFLKVPPSKVLFASTDHHNK